MYPIALDLRGRTAVIAGGGSVAARKLRGLREAGARVIVVALRAGEEIRSAAERGDVELRERAFEPADLEGALLAFAATDDADVNAAVVAAARARDVLVNDATGTNPGDFSNAMAHRTGAVTFTVDTGGLSPSFARRLRDELRERFDERYGRAATTLGRARDYVKAVIPAAERAAIMAGLAERPVDELAAMNPSSVENEVEAAYDALRAGPSAATPEPVTQLVCATRASALAMWQTKHVMAEFAKAGIASTVLQISTKGDRIVDRALAALGTDSIFVKELELALRDGRADYAVHSCKDLPSSLPDDMRLCAIGPRADPRDAYCSERYPALDALPPGALVGTSSPRRRAQLQALRPDLRFEVIRGNVDTRLRKLRDGEFDAILLAMAGLTRLGLRATYTVPLPVETLIPAVGQGALAIETRAADSVLGARLHALFADPATELAVRAERAFLRTLRGGCQAPVGAHGRYDDDVLEFRAAISSVDGARVVRGAFTLPTIDPAAAEARSEEFAHQLLAEGGAELLAPGPLAGLLLLLPRTQERPSQIAPALRGAGAEVVEAADGGAAAETLGDRIPDALLFPSSGSVRAIATYLSALRAKAGRPIVATMGAASSAAAAEAGFPPDVVASEAGVPAFVHAVTRHMIERLSADSGAGGE